MEQLDQQTLRELSELVCGDGGPRYRKGRELPLFFRAASLRRLLGSLEERTWLLDVEILSLIQRQGGRAREEPINWSDPGGSKLSLGIAPMKMFLGLWKLSRRLDRGAVN